MNPIFYLRRLGANRLRSSKLALFAVLYAAVFAVPLVCMITGSEWLKQQSVSLWWIVPTGFTGIVATVIYMLFVRSIENRLLKDQRRYHRTLIAASSGMTRIKDIQQLCQLIVHMVNRTVGLTHTALFLYQPK